MLNRLLIPLNNGLTMNMCEAASFICRGCCLAYLSIFSGHWASRCVQLSSCSTLHIPSSDIANRTIIAANGANIMATSLAED